MPTSMLGSKKKNLILVDILKEIQNAFLFFFFFFAKIWLYQECNHYIWPQASFSVLSCVRKQTKKGLYRHISDNIYSDTDIYIYLYIYISVISQYRLIYIHSLGSNFSYSKTSLGIWEILKTRVAALLSLQPITCPCIRIFSLRLNKLMSSSCRLHLTIYVPHTHCLV